MLLFTSIPNRTSRNSHVIPLRRFVELPFKEDLRGFPIDSCFKVNKDSALINCMTVHTHLAQSFLLVYIPQLKWLKSSQECAIF